MPHSPIVDFALEINEEEYFDAMQEISKLLLKAQVKMQGLQLPKMNKEWWLWNEAYFKLVQVDEDVRKIQERSLRRMEVMKQ